MDVDGAVERELEGASPEALRVLLACVTAKLQKAGKAAAPCDESPYVKLLDSRIFPKCFNGSNLRVCLKKLFSRTIQLVNNSDDGTCSVLQSLAGLPGPALPLAGSASAFWASKGPSTIKYHLMLHIYLTMDHWPCSDEHLPVIEQIAKTAQVPVKLVRGHIGMIKDSHLRQLKAGSFSKKALNSRKPSPVTLPSNTPPGTIVVFSAVDPATWRVVKKKTNMWIFEFSSDMKNWTQFEVDDNKTFKTDDPSNKLSQEEEVQLQATRSKIKQEEEFILKWKHELMEMRILFSLY